MLLKFTFLVGILAIGDGNITIDKLAPRQAVPSDPITIP